MDQNNQNIQDAPADADDDGDYYTPGWNRKSAPKTHPAPPRLFAVRTRRREDENVPSYAVLDPLSSRILPSREHEHLYASRPLTISKKEAEALAAALTRETGREWFAEEAPTPCANCGRDIWADDLDFCYPGNREMTSWRAGCNEHDFGCGHEVEADSYEAVMAAWRAPVKAA